LGCQPVRVGQRLRADRLVEGGESRPVGQQLPDGDLLLAVLRELGPLVGRDPFIEVEEAAAVRDRERHRCQTFGR
jgi:hypothetical protein